MNYENEKICDRGCERTFIDETTQQATCGVGSGDNSQTVRVRADENIEEVSNTYDRLSGFERQ